MNTDNKSDPTLEQILEELDNNLANAPGTATEIGWEAWAEEKQEYYAKAHSQIEALFISCLGEGAAPSEKLGKEYRGYARGYNDAIGVAKEIFNKRLGRK